VGKPETLPSTGLHGGNLLAVNDLLDCIEQGDRQPRCSMYDGRWTIEMIASVFESHRQQAEVTLPLKNRANPLSLL
jgi:aspartate oxidase